MIINTDSRVEVAGTEKPVIEEIQFNPLINVLDNS
jgi:hypothetical protein